MFSRLTILFFLSLFCTGCTPYFLFSTTEKNAREHMKAAVAHEQAAQFENASKAYQMVQNHFSQTSYYEDAVYAEFLIHMNTENPTPNFNRALVLVQNYLTFDLSCSEKRQAQHYERLLTKIKLKQDQEKKRSSELMLLRKEIEASRAKAKDLEDRLQKIKAIDVQMYKNKRRQP